MIHFLIVYSLFHDRLQRPREIEKLAAGMGTTHVDERLRIFATSNSYTNPFNHLGLSL